MTKIEERISMLDWEEAKGVYNLNPGPSLRLLQATIFIESLIALDRVLG